MVRRGAGLTAEQGTLLFVQGQVTEARVGRRSGSAALNWLSTWGQAHYLFTPLVTEKEMPLGDGASAPIVACKTTHTGPLRPAPHVNTDKLERESSLIAASDVLNSTIACAEATARIDQAGLSRTHKHLYLLINGQRTALECVPLVGRKVEEVRNMLHDLEWLGVIRVGNSSPSTES
jgi:hypothetical protein